jgi:cell fate regulator YaaT (PSP1 superfamily)
MHDAQNYLLSYGNAGDFGRFNPVEPMSCRRGDRAVIRTPRGLELGTVLCPTTPGHAQHLANTSVGHLLRLANAEDMSTASRMRLAAQRVLDDGQQTAAELGLPLELVDAEMLLDGQRAIIYHVRWDECDVRPLVSSLSRRHDVHIELEDLSRADQGCGKPNCGRSNGGCQSCGSGGGCGTCGSHGADDLQAYFAQLREQMLASNRTSLL